MNPIDGALLHWINERGELEDMTFCVVDCNVDSLSGFPHLVLPGCIHPLPPNQQPSRW